MTMLKILLVLLYFASLVNSSGLRTIKFKKTTNFLNLVHDQYHAKLARDSSWTYASCEPYQSAANNIQCSLVFETNKPDGRIYKDTCRILLDNAKREKMQKILDNHLRVFQFGSNKAIVAWQDQSNTTRFYTVAFPNCQISQASIDNHVESYFGSTDYYDQVKVLSYSDDKFHVFYANKSSHDEVTWYAITFDENAHKIDGPTQLFKYNNIDIPHFVDVVEDFNDNMGRHVLAQSTYNSLTFWQLGKAGEMKEILSYNDSAHKLIEKVDVSLANDIIGICQLYEPNKSITCEQRNRKGERILQTDLKAGYRNDYHSQWMYNLPAGGFLLFAWNCPRDLECQDNSYLSVTKVDAKGTRYRTLQILDNSQDSFLDYHRVRDGFFQNAADEYCWYQLIKNAHSHEITHVCFTDQQLSEKYV